MTNETKIKFSAPWKTTNLIHASWEQDFEVSRQDGTRVAVCPTEEDSKRVSYIPELWDALLESAAQRCWRCSCANKDYLLRNGCPKKNEDCYVCQWIKLLHDVRDGK